MGLATPVGLEPTTCRLEGGCSIQLSYGATPIPVLAGPPPPVHKRLPAQAFHPRGAGVRASPGTFG